MIPRATFDVTVREGRLQVLAADKRRYDHFLQRCGDGLALEMVLGDAEEVRTLAQNAYLHAEPVKKLCQAEGYTPAQAKLILLGEHFGWMRLPSGVFVPERSSTSELTKAEMTALIEWCPVFGAERGYDIRPPAKKEPRSDARG